ncbi:uncharacterized protein PG998_011946 [Apiospora kogelbergensis]|uniref:uncharacterized protein n=1 Tax=Apiospora kogelbergensis TaxID=1337665 RepID=UPI00312D9601
MDGIPDRIGNAETTLPLAATTAEPRNSEFERVVSQESQNLQRQDEITPMHNLSNEMHTSSGFAAESDSHTSNNPDIGLQELSSGVTNPQVDIVFVHGLRGSKLGSWSRDNICWPREFLQKDLPEARVFSFGWDADVTRVRSNASQDSIFGHAVTLLNDLELFREDKVESHTEHHRPMLTFIQTYPIIFIAHSLGGLLVKQMLIKAAAYQQNGRHESLGSPFLHTAGIIFMGTPHHGSDQQPYGSLLAKIAKFCLLPSNTVLLDILHRDSEVLCNQRDEFVTISNKYDVVCFYEELKTSGVTVVPKSSAVLTDFKVRSCGIHANHMDMIKFRSNQDTGYKRILQHVRRQMKPKTSSLEMELRQRILDCLWFSLINHRKDTIDPAFHQTCDWLLTSLGKPNEPVDLLTSWLSSKSESIFWISGKAGSGKSTLMKYLHENTISGQKLGHSFLDDAIVASFFFYKEDNRCSELQMSREGMVRSILHQCLKEKKAWIREVYPELFTPERLQQLPDEILRSETSDWHCLQKAFSNMLRAAQRDKQNILLLIDGLDEYRILQRTAEYTQDRLELLYGDKNDDEQWGYSDWIYDGYNDLIKLLETFGNSEHIKTCVSSRELPIFETRFRSKFRIRVQEHTRSGIAHYCSMRLAQQACDQRILQDLIRQVSYKAEGVFLWVRIVVGLIEQRITRGKSGSELQELVNSLPPQIGGKCGLYWHMVEQIPQDALQHASRMLYIMLGYIRYPNISPDPGGIDLFQLICAAESVTTQEQASFPPSRHELEILRQNITSLLDRPDTYPEHDPGDPYNPLKRQLQSDCLGLLELYEAENVSYLWASPSSRDYLWDHTHHIKTYGVKFMHSTVRDFLSRDFTQRRLKREFFSIPLALADGIPALRKDNHLLARWLLTRYSRNIATQMHMAWTAMPYGKACWSAFENMNVIVRTIRSAIANCFPFGDVRMDYIQSFWHQWKDDEEEPDIIPDEMDATEIVDNLCIAAYCGYHTYVEARLMALDEDTRSRRLSGLLAESISILKRG